MVAAVLTGDPEAYRALVQRYQGGMLRFAFRMMGDADQAMDLVQAALIRGFERLRQCRDPAHIGHWLLAILANQCRHALRRRRPHLPLDEVQGDSMTARESPVTALEHTELQGLLQRALRRLPASQREAFLLRHAEGLSYEEMAPITGASIAALKQRVHRARETMSAFLEERW